MNYKNKKIVIFGLGVYEKGSGISAAIFFAKRGAQLLITDLKSKKELSHQLKRLKKYKNIEYVLGRHRKKDFKNADFIFRNPSVPKDSFYLKTARKNKIPIINDWTLFFEEQPDNLVIGVTGTKGKSTTATIISHVLKKAGKNVVLCGNIGQSPLVVLGRIKKNTIVVAEFSSWLLADLRISPHIAVITNLMPDHLDKYESLEDYYKDKENIFLFQGRDDYLFLNRDSEQLRKFARKTKSKVVWFSGAGLGALVIAVAEILDVPEDFVEKAVKSFKGVPGRLEFAQEKEGVKYYNDTCATIPEATIYALNSLKDHKGRIVLICGGMDKELDYKKLSKMIPKYAKVVFLLEGSASKKILEKLRIPAYKLHKNLKTMDSAVKMASAIASSGDIILLSPGAASFNLFKNEFDRGEQFIEAIK